MNWVSTWSLLKAVLRDSNLESEARDYDDKYHTAIDQTNHMAGIIKNMNLYVHECLVELAYLVYYCVIITTYIGSTYTCLFINWFTSIAAVVHNITWF